MKANPRHAHFLAALEKHATVWPTPWEGACWRFQSISFPSPGQILDGMGAFKAGGRWNACRAFPAVYGSTDDITAVKESAAVAKYAGFPMREPRLLIAIHFQLEKILDLTSTTIRRKLGITLKEIREENWRKLQQAGTESLSQSLGRAAHLSGA